MQQTVMITGAAGGIGANVTAAFLSAGWRVLAVCRSEAQSDKLRAHCTAFGDSLVVGLADLTREEDVARCVQAASSSLKAVVHLVGGFSGGNPIEHTSIEIIDEMLARHVRTTFLVLHSVLPVLKRSGGAIVTVGARAVQHPTANVAAYAAAKSAVASLTQSAAEEGKPFGVRANCILPGIIATPDNLSWGSDDDVQRWTRPDDIASAAVYLCSDAASGINGALLPMFGKLPL